MQLIGHQDLNGLELISGRALARGTELEAVSYTHLTLPTKA